MKLRIKGNSIRLRLLKSEVEKLRATGRVSEEMRFGPRPADVFIYTVVVEKNIQAVTMRYEKNEMVVTLPANAAAEWIDGDQTGIAATHITGTSGTGLSILVEKDLVCIDRPDDPDREDAFPNPKINC